MKCLRSALSSLTSDCETSIQVIQRDLYLLKHHIDSFRQKYAFQVRRILSAELVLVYYVFIGLVVFVLM